MAPNPEQPDRRNPDQTVAMRHGKVQDASTDFVVVDDPEFIGNYELLDELGAGGMGRVFKAKERGTNRILALKTLLPQYISTAALVQRFKKEALAAGKLHHPGIVPVYGVHESNGIHFFTMALIEGSGLDERLRQGPLDNRMAARVVRQVAEAVAHAHQNGIVHRDLKPGNILLDRRGNVKVTDFGLAREINVVELDDGAIGKQIGDLPAGGTRFRLTQAGTVMGTPGFLAPEQATSGTTIGPAADVWALGALLYATLTGRPPFVGATALETVAMTVEDDPVPPTEINPNVHPDLSDICLNCLQKDPRSRFASATALGEALRRWSERHVERSRGPSRWRQLQSWLVAVPELPAVLSGLAVHRLGNIQEGVFVGCAVAGIGLSGKRSWEILALPIGVLATLVAAVACGRFVGPQRLWIAGALFSMSGLLCLAVTIVCGMIALELPRRFERVRVVAVLMLIAGLVGTALSFSDILELSFEFPRQLSRVAGWLIAAPLGLASGALLGQIRQRMNRLGREPIPAFAVGAAVAAMLAAFVWSELRPDGSVTTAQIAAFGPGPTLALAEDRTARALPPTGVAVGPEELMAASAGIFCLKWLHYIVPMAAGAMIAGITVRMASEESRP